MQGFDACVVSVWPGLHVSCADGDVVSHWYPCSHLRLIPGGGRSRGPGVVGGARSACLVPWHRRDATGGGLLLLVGFGQRTHGARLVLAPAQCGEEFVVFRRIEEHA